MKTQLVARGVDTLVLNFYYLGDDGKPFRQPIPEELKEQLDTWKQAAIVAEEPVLSRFRLKACLYTSTPTVRVGGNGGGCCGAIASICSFRWVGSMASRKCGSHRNTSGQF